MVEGSSVCSHDVSAAFLTRRKTLTILLIAIFSSVRLTSCPIAAGRAVSLFWPTLVSGSFRSDGISCSRRLRRVILVNSNKAEGRLRSHKQGPQDASQSALGVPGQMIVGHCDTQLGALQSSLVQGVAERRPSLASAHWSSARR